MKNTSFGHFSKQPLLITRNTKEENTGKKREREKCYYPSVSSSLQKSPPVLLTAPPFHRPPPFFLQTPPKEDTKKLPSSSDFSSCLPATTSVTFSSSFLPTSAFNLTGRLSPHSTPLPLLLLPLSLICPVVTSQGSLRHAACLFCSPMLFQEPTSHSPSLFLSFSFYLSLSHTHTSLSPWLYLLSLLLEARKRLYASLESSSSSSHYPSASLLTLFFSSSPLSCGLLPRGMNSLSGIFSNKLPITKPAAQNVRVEISKFSQTHTKINICKTVKIDLCFYVSIW